MTYPMMNNFPTLGGIHNALSVENKPGGMVYDLGGGGGVGGGGGNISPLDVLRQALAAGSANAEAAVKSAQSGVDSVLSGGGQIKSAISGMNAQAGNMIDHGDKVNLQGNKVNQTADEMKQLYGQLGPIAQLLSGKGSDLWNIGQALSTDANDIFGQGKALLNMDPNAGGLAGEFIKYWQSLSPDRYVSQAASDTQAAAQNAKDQALRDLSRRGVSASSGAYGAILKQFGTLMATAMAAAKTRARQAGLDAQAAQLGKMTEAFNALYGAGNQTQSNALSALAESINANKAAADTLATQAQGFGQVGSLQQSAGQLFASAASIFGDAGQLMGSAGQLQNQYLSLVNQAYGNLSSAESSAANYSLGAANAEVSARNGGGGGGSQVVATSDNGWVKIGSGRDNTKSGSPLVTTWMNTKTGQQVSGDAFFDPNK